MSNSIVWFVIQEDPIIHTAERPFCSIDSTCPCHVDEDNIELVNNAVRASVLTRQEGDTFILGQPLSLASQNAWECFLINNTPSYQHVPLGYALAQQAAPVVTNPSRRAAIYARITTTHDDPSGAYALATQIQACRLYCQEQGYIIAPDHIYQDIGLETTAGHTQLKRLRDATRQGLIDVVVLYRYNRLSMDVDCQVMIVDELEECGIVVESVTESHQEREQFQQRLESFLDTITDVERKELQTLFERAQRRQRQSSCYSVHTDHGSRIVAFFHEYIASKSI